MRSVRWFINKVFIAFSFFGILATVGTSSVQAQKPVEDPTLRTPDLSQCLKQASDAGVEIFLMPEDHSDGICAGHRFICEAGAIAGKSIHLAEGSAFDPKEGRAGITGWEGPRSSYESSLYLTNLYIQPLSSRSKLSQRTMLQSPQIKEWLWDIFSQLKQEDVELLTKFGASRPQLQQSDLWKELTVFLKDHDRSLLEDRFSNGLLVPKNDTDHEKEITVALLKAIIKNPAESSQVLSALMEPLVKSVSSQAGGAIDPYTLEGFQHFVGIRRNKFASQSILRAACIAAEKGLKRVTVQMGWAHTAGIFEELQKSLAAYSAPIGIKVEHGIHRLARLGDQTGSSSNNFTASESANPMNFMEISQKIEQERLAKLPMPEVTFNPFDTLGFIIEQYALKKNESPLPTKEEVIAELQRSLHKEGNEGNKAIVNDLIQTLTICPAPSEILEQGRPNAEALRKYVLDLVGKINAGALKNGTIRSESWANDILPHMGLDCRDAAMVRRTGENLLSYYRTLLKPEPISDATLKSIVSDVKNSNDFWQIQKSFSTSTKAK